MTAVILLEQLKNFVEEQLKDLMLPVRVSSDSGERKERAPEVHLQNLPNFEAETQRVPYVLLQFVKGSDTQQSGHPPDSSCMIRIVVACYDKNGSDGAMHVLNVLTRIRIAILKLDGGVLAEQFKNIPPLEMLAYPADVSPYYLGEMMTSWKIPSISGERVL